MGKVKVFMTDGRADGQRDRGTDEWNLMSPRFRESGGQYDAEKLFIKTVCKT